MTSLGDSTQKLRSLGRAGKSKGMNIDEFGSLVVVMFATSVTPLGLAVAIRDHEAAVRQQIVTATTAYSRILRKRRTAPLHRLASTAVHPGGEANSSPPAHR